MRQSIKHKLISALFISALAFLGVVATVPQPAAAFSCSGVCQVKCKDGSTKTYDIQRSLGTIDQICGTKGVASVGTASAAAGSETPEQVSTDNPKCHGPGQPKNGATPTAPAGYNCIYQNYLVPLGVVLSALVGVAVVAGIIIGGIQYSTSGGDPQKVAAAKARITKALIGLVVYFFLYAILQFIVPGGVTQ
jgi:hypothetical protein